MENIYRIFCCRFDERNWDANLEPETWRVFHCNAMFTAVKCGSNEWVNTLMLCDEDLGADGPYDHFVRIGDLMDDATIQQLIRHSFADALAGEYGTWVRNVDESLFEWECVVNMMELHESDYLRSNLKEVA